MPFYKEKKCVYIINILSNTLWLVIKYIPLIVK